MRYVLISGGTIANIIEWDGNASTWQPPEGTEAVPYEGPCEPGWQWADGAPVAPERPAVPLENLKAGKLLEVAGHLAALNAAGFEYNGKTYQLDDASQQRIAALALKAWRAVSGVEGATWAEDFAFIAADNTAVPFTAADFGAFADAAANAVIARRLNARALKNAVLAAASAAELDSVDITAGW